jgi:hypothetical protein
MEFVPHGDLHQLLSKRLKLEGLTFKWRLKMAIDIASGMRFYLFIFLLCSSDLFLYLVTYTSKLLLFVTVISALLIYLYVFSF